MAVQAQYYAAYAFHHDIRPAMDNVTSAPVFLGEPRGGGHLMVAAAQQAVGGDTVFSDPRSDLTFNENKVHDIDRLGPRKRARVGGDAGACPIVEGHGALMLPPEPQVFASPAGDAQSRALCSAAASTAGRPAPVSQGLLSHLYRHGLEIDAFIRIENERLRAGMEEARRRHVRAVVSAVERAAARQFRDAGANLERVLARNAELEEKLRQVSGEAQAWRGVAESHGAVAAGLRETLDQLLQSPQAGVGEGATAEGEAEDAESCCFEQQEEQRAAERGEASGGARACVACGGAEACVLLLPCRHLCLCGGCEAAVDACPVCAAAKNASLHVLLC